MARVSIYVTDELKARMTEAGDALNWSDIARPAFEAALADFNHRRGPSMTTAIERLRASKQQYLESTATNGARAGREWAESKASFGELKRLAHIDLSIYEDDPEHIESAIKRVVDPDDTLHLEYIPQILFGDRTWAPGEWLVGWVRGAQEFFEEVKDQL